MHMWISKSAAALRKARTSMSSTVAPKISMFSASCSQAARMYAGFITARLMVEVMKSSTILVSRPGLPEHEGLHSLHVQAATPSP